MIKEMNWMYVKENYGTMFRDSFNKESDVLDVISLSLAEASDKTMEELLDGVRRIEGEMRFLVDNFRTNPKMATKLSSWCMNMNQNLVYCIENIELREVAKND